MKLRKKILIGLGVLVAVAFISGASILAATSLGTQSDPLVTLSYLTGIFKPQIMNDVNASISSAEASLQPSLDGQIAAFKSDIEAKLSGSSTQSAASFTLVTLNKNQTLACGVGTEVLLRLGSAAVAGSSPGLVDSTAGSTLSSGGALSANHMYMVSIQGNGLKATSSSVKVLVRGSYAVG
jgi:hypothetical protein